jgi:hypothetical protein
VDGRLVCIKINQKIKDGGCELDSFSSGLDCEHGNELIALMMQAARTSEMLVNFYQTTWCYNPEDSYLCTHHHENLKSYFSS